MQRRDRCGTSSAIRSASGDLEGKGTWSFEPREGGTRVRYVWAVRTTRRWMNLPIPLARRVFALNHDAIMARGAEGLARELGVRVVDRTKEARSDHAARS
jgi:hypothetical protein